MRVATELPPIVGEDRVIGKSRCRWVVCPVCGEERWVELRKGVPRSRSCRRHDTLETREKKRQALIGRPCSQETRGKISKARMGHIGYMLGKHHTVKTKRKLSLLKKGRIVSAETKEKLRQINLGKRVSDETKAKISLALKMWLANHGRVITEVTREKLRQSHLGQRPSVVNLERLRQASIARWRQPEYRERTLERLRNVCREGGLSRKGHPVSPETRAKISASLMGHEFTEETRTKWLAARQKSLHVKPNQKEIQLLHLLNNLYPNEWKFVGDWELVIAGKNPDFANVNGKKLLIELFGDYWHRNDNPKERVSLFSKYGYHTLIIWERELKDEVMLTQKIQEFVN